MALNIQTATRKLRDFLITNLTDPLSSRAGAWIYDDGMRVDLDKAPFPKILLKKLNEPSLKELKGIGSTDTINTDQVFIEVKADKGKHYTVDSDDYTAGEFVGYLASEAEKLVKSNHNYFVSQGFLSVLPFRDEIDSDKDGNPIFRLGIEMKYISGSN